MDTQQAVLQLASIAQSARLEIFRLLVQAGNEGLAAGSISSQLDIPTSTLSFHLRALTHASLISAEQQGRFIYYRANYDNMNALIAYLTENCCGGKTQCCPPASTFYMES